MNTEKQCISDMDADNWFNDFDETVLEIVSQPGMEKEQTNEIIDDDVVDESECIYVEDIIEIDLTTLNTIDIIQHQCSFAHFIKAMIENTNKSFYNSDNIADTDTSEKRTPDMFTPVQQPTASFCAIQKKSNINPRGTTLKSIKYINDGSAIVNQTVSDPNEIQFITPVTLSAVCPDFQMRTKKTDKLMSSERLSDIIIYLKWMSSVSELLANRIGQDLIKDDIVDTNTYPQIIRSSYTFCVKSTQCKNFYNKNEFPTCKNHHYVHSLLKYDIDSIIVFLQHIANNDIDLTMDQLNNIFLSIKTICFVTKNMQKEIYYIHYITKNNSEIYHRNNPIDMHKKITYTKQDKYTPNKGGFTQYNNKPTPSYKPRQFIHLDQGNIEPSNTKSHFVGQTSAEVEPKKTEPDQVVHSNQGHIELLPHYKPGQFVHLSHRNTELHLADQHSSISDTINTESHIINQISANIEPIDSKTFEPVLIFNKLPHNISNINRKIISRDNNGGPSNQLSKNTSNTPSIDVDNNSIQENDYVVINRKALNKADGISVINRQTVGKNKSKKTQKLTNVADSSEIKVEKNINMYDILNKY